MSELAKPGARQDLPLPLAALAEAQDFLGLEEIGGDNRGPMVEFFQMHAGIPEGAPWCGGFVNGCVHTACAKKNVPSPLEEVPRQGFVQDYVDWARKEDRIVPAHQVEPGDLFALHFESKGRFAHVGFVYDVPRDGYYSTLEGNTDDEASREGVKVAARERDVTEHTVFIRWSED